MSPFGFISDGITDENNTFIDESGDRWYTDEYGDIASLWSYQ